MGLNRGVTYEYQPIKLDVHMHVVRTLWAHSDGVQLDVIWVNRFSPNILNADRVFVKRQDIPKWKAMS